MHENRIENWEMINIKKEPNDNYEFTEQEPSKSYNLKIKQKRRGRPSKRSSLTCPLCSYETDTFENLIEHTKIHPDKCVFPCPYCHSLFSQKGNLRAHIRVHTRERPFTCTMCSFSSAQRGNLLAHQRIHTKEKPYKCPLCEFTSAQAANLRSHQLRRHAENTRLFLQVKLYPCNYCNVVCKTKHILKKHCMEQHVPPLHFMDCSKES